jgi:membrane fusion protein (multidrug efflux system)
MTWMQALVPAGHPALVAEAVDLCRLSLMRCRGGSSSSGVGPAALLAAALGLGLLLPGAAGAADKKASAEADKKAPPPSVVVAPVEVENVSPERHFIGTIKAIQSVELKARVEGFLDEVAFDQGHMVDRGQILYMIEQAPYQADLYQAQGQLAAAKADQASAQATLEDKQADFERQSVLVKKGDTSKTDFDRAKAARDEAAASVKSAEASEQQAQAAIDTALINLGYTIVRSPIKGRIGATNFTQGNLVDSSSGTLATVVQLDPIRAVFSVSSADFVKFQKKVSGEGVERAEQLFVPKLILPTGEEYDEKGTVAFADNQVDPSTGTIKIYADFPNPDHVLLPGQFITALVSTTEQKRAPVVPAAAIQRTREGTTVYVVGKDDRIEERTIKTGVQFGTGYEVTSGLQGGEIVVISGVQKVKPGIAVKPVKQSEAGPQGASVSIDSSGANSGDTESASPKAQDGGNGGQDSDASTGSKADSTGGGESAPNEQSSSSAKPTSDKP